MNEEREPPVADVSVIVPVYEDPAGIRTTLQTLAEQTYPTTSYEVIVVDNGSTDATPAAVRTFVDRRPDLVSLVFEDAVRGSYAARNRGLEHADGALIAFVDADVTVPRTWLSSVVETMAAEGCDYLGCDVRTVEGRPETTMEAYSRRNAFPVERYLERDHFAPTCCLVVRREVFDAVGCFDERLISSGDAEFGRRVHEAGFDQHFAPDIPVFHPPRSAVELLKKQFRIGRGFAQRRRHHPDRFEHRPLLDPRLYLPTLSPAQLRASADEVVTESEGDLGVRTLLAFYLLDYFVGLSRAAGRLAERVAGRFREPALDPPGSRNGPRRAP